MTFNISNTFDEWVAHFGSHIEIQAAAGFKPLFRGPHEDDLQKVCIVMQIEDDSELEAFMAENEAAILESRHLLETTESNTYLYFANNALIASTQKGEATYQYIPAVK